MVMRSRTQVWITQVRPKAKAMKNACFACKRSARRLGEQKMAPLPDPTMGSGPNRSTAVEKNGGVGPIRCSGRGAIFCSPSFLADLLHAKHAFFTALAFGRTCVIHTWVRLRMTIASTPA